MSLAATCKTTIFLVQALPIVKEWTLRSTCATLGRPSKVLHGVVALFAPLSSSEPPVGDEAVGDGDVEAASPFLLGCVIVPAEVKDVGPDGEMGAVVEHPEPVAKLSISAKRWLR